MGFHALLWEPLSRFARGFPRVALGKLCWLASQLRDVTEEPCWNHGVDLMLVLHWDGSVVTLLVLRRYGVYTVFDSRVRYLSQPVLRRWRASFESRKSYKRANCTLARCFKQSDLALPTGGWSNQSVCMGRSPAHVQAFWGGIHVIQYFIHSVEDTNLQILYICLVTHDAKV